MWSNTHCRVGSIKCVFVQNVYKMLKIRKIYIQYPWTYMNNLSPFSLGWCLVRNSALKLWLFKYSACPYKINLLQPSVAYPLLEILKVFWCFQGYRIWKLGNQKSENIIRPVPCLPCINPFLAIASKLTQK